MIDPQSIDLHSLPWVPLRATAGLPEDPAIYFAFDSLGTVQYIGLSKNVRQRWKNHHRYEELQAIAGIRIAYLFVDTPELLPSIEAALIEWFDPPLNRIKPSSGQLQSPPEKATYPTVDLKELRERSGLSAERVAAELGKSVSTIRFWEAGTYKPNLDPSEMLQLVRLYQCSIEDLSEAFKETQHKRRGVDNR